MERRTQKMKQAVLAKGICSISYLSRIENGKIEPNEEVVEMLFNRLELSFPEKPSVERVDVDEIKELCTKIINLREDIPKIMAEMHLYIASKKGHTLGAVRIPLEKMILPPDELVRVDNNSIYMISPQEGNLSIYEIKPGKIFAKHLKNRIERFKESKEYSAWKSQTATNKTEEQVVTIAANTGPNGYLHRSDVANRADRMIGYSWKVISGNKQQGIRNFTS
ncbi:helix-turn-helix transcriptional regulator [Sporosarcina sp. FSL W8-0480]|uniref:helix-turn-helix domain-containing protein n=1 Tax=Sporosarcina sp. FSL W8-0480 TaxID=2954701 RepID=UPI0030D8C6FF